MNTRTMMWTVARSAWRLAILVGVIALVIALPRDAAAQSVNATLRGNAPASSEVTATNTATGLTRSVQVGSDGSYVLVGLPPGTYRVDAGTGTERVVTLGLASTGTLDFGEEQAAALGEVVVSGAQLREVRTSEVGTGISLHQIENVPQITRNFLEFADTVPGMQFQVDGKGNTQIRSGALNPGSTNVYIDGVGQKNYVRPSGITGQGGVSSNPRGGENQTTVGDPGNPFPQLAIGEYKVITSNYKAEYDQVAGAAITAVTKSGTNEFEAQGFMTYTESGFREETPAEVAAGTGKVGGSNKEYGFAVSGPIIKDRLHYLFTYEAKEFSTPNTVFPPALVDPDGVALDWVGSLTPELRENYGPVANPFDEDLFFAKLDWQLTDVDRLEFSAKSRRERSQAGAAGTVAESAAFTYVNDDERAQLRWEHNFGDRIFNEATFTYEDAEDSPSKSSSEPGQRFIALGSGTTGTGFDPLLQINGVDPLGYFFSTQKGWGFQNDVTFIDLEWRGDHTVKAGFKFKDVELSFQDAGAEALYSFYVHPDVPDAGVEADPFEVTFGALADDAESALSVSKNRQFGLYLQDDWQVNDKLVLNIGVRWDYEDTPTYTDYVTPQRFIDGIFSQDENGCPVLEQNAVDCPDYFFNGAYRGSQPGQTYADTLAAAGIDINDYISTGNNRDNQTDNIAPRFGFSYDLHGDQRHVLFGGAGRSYDRNVFGILQHETNKASLYVPTVQFFNPENPSCAGVGQASDTCVAWDDAYLTPEGLASIAPSNFGEMHFLNNDLDTPYSDQYSLGMRNVIGDWNTSAAVAYIYGYDGVIANLANYFGDGTWYWYDTGFWSGYTAPVSNAGAGWLYLFDNAKATRATQLLLSADKPYSAESGWSAGISYTFTDAEDRLEFNGDYQFDYAFNYYAPYVRSGQVAEHRLVAYGSYDAPWGITLGAKTVVETPKPLNCICTFVPDFPAANGLNYNWIRTARRPDEDVGYFSLDLQATKTFEFGEKSAVQLRVDVLNVTNRKNYSDYTNFYDVTPPQYFKDGNIWGVPRTFKVGFNLRF